LIALSYKNEQSTEMENAERKRRNYVQRYIHFERFLFLNFKAKWLLSCYILNVLGILVIHRC
jgi:hypothetical protein